jgi:serine/threonine protein kinase
VEKQDVYLVYEYCEGGTLEDRITMEEHQFMAYFGQIIEALCRAEAKNIMHRDIKPANILFKDGKIKVADWGFSRLLEFGETTCSFIGSPAYMAPEVLKGEEYSLKADVWSLGIVAYECLFGVCPWSSKSIAALSNEISHKALHLPQERGLSKTTQKILSSMLNADPLGRPTFKEIRNMLNVKVMSSPKLSRSEAVLSCKQSR